MSLPASSRFFPAGTVLFREGDPGADMYIVQEGTVRITRDAADGRTLTLAMIGTGEFFGEMAIVNNLPRGATATVEEDAWLLVVDAATFDTLVREHAEVAVRLIKDLARRLDQANQQVELLLVKDRNHRVARCLRRLAESGAALADGAVFVALTDAQLATRTGLEVPEVADAVERLAAAGLAERATDADGLVLPDVTRLEEFVAFLEMKERLAG